MKFTTNLLKEMYNTGGDFCLYSEELREVLDDKINSLYSKRSYYYWKEGSRPFPIKFVLSFLTKKELDEIEVSKFSVKGGNEFIPPKENIFLCYFLGLILGDGCLIKSRRDTSRSTYLINITFRTLKEAENINSLANVHLGLSGSIYKQPGCYQLCIYSKPLVLMFSKKYQIPIGFKYQSITVPDIIRNSSPIRKAYFVKGVFDSDGNLYSYRKGKAVQIRQKSQKFINEIQVLLDEIGLSFRKPYRDKANNSYVLWSNKKELVDSFINQVLTLNIIAPVAQPG